MKKVYYGVSIGVLSLLMLMSVPIFAQTVRVSGTVLDDGGAPLPGVSVIEKGTSNGSTTDVDGKYSVNVSDPNATLVFSFIGYKATEVGVGNRTTVDITLAADVTSLQEVVVTGYTTENRREVTGAVSTLKPRELVAVPSGNIEQQLQGRVPGVTVISNGQPGTSSVVRIRGFNGFGDNSPLVIVDGVPTTNTNFLAPDDIETTTVLKDAASASIYGARAANGVIVYTTKRGKKGDGKLRITYDGVVGFTSPGKVDNILNPQETADWTWNAIRNTATQLGETPEFDHPQYGTGASPVLPDYLAVGGQSGVIGTVNLDAERANYNVDVSKGAIYQVIPSNKAGTNWWDAITNTAPLNRHSLGFAGGGERSSFYVGLNMQDQDGILLHQNFKRYSIRVNSEFDLAKGIRLGENLQLTYLNIRGLTGGSGGRGAANEENDFLQAFRMPSIIPVYDAFGGYAGTAAKGFNNPRNPVASRDRQANNNGYGIGIRGNIYLEVDPIKDLTIRSSIGGGFANSYSYFYAPPSYENSENNSSFTYGENAFAGNDWVFTNTANYKRKFGVHGIDVLAGIEALNTGVSRSLNGSGLNPFSTDPNFINLGNTQASGRVVNSGYGRGINYFSLFGQFKYNFNEKYMFNAVIRRDGSSVFGPNNRYGVFPAFSAAWRISEENFLKGVAFVSDLKLRGGWGQMGNSRIDPTNQFNLYAVSLGNSAYDITGSNSGVSSGIYRSRIGNPNAKWETSETTNFGFDGSFLDGKLDVVFDWWRKDTEDLLFTLETPAVVGPVASDPAVNIASMRNQGVDIEVATRGTVVNDLSFEVRLTSSFLNNEIVSLAPGVPYFDAGGTRNGNVIRNQVGRPLSSYFGYQVVGLFQNQAEVDAAPAQDGKGVGRFRFADLNNDNVVNADDRTYLGDPVPDFNGGINLRLNYKNFELETFLAVFLGVENYNFSKWFTDFYPSFTGAAIGKNVRNSFTFERGGNTVPIFENISNFSTNTQSNSYYVENGNYARMTNLQLAYNVPASLVGRYGFTRARVYLQGTNLFTISNYSGLDPGVAGGADTTLGIDVGNPPVTRGFNLGLNLAF